MPVTRKSKKVTRRVARRKQMVPRNIRRRTPVHSFHRDVQFQVLNGTLADPYLERQFWKLNELPAFAEFTALYDEYQISYVKVIWRLEVDPGAQTGATAVYPRLTTYKDFNDTNIPANINVIRERERKQITTMYPGKNIVRTIKPAIQTAVLKSPSGVVVNAPKWNQWLPTAVPDVEHLGFKYAIERWNNANYTINVLYRYYLKCRHVQ